MIITVKNRINATIIIGTKSSKIIKIKKKITPRFTDQKQKFSKNKLNFVLLFLIYEKSTLIVIKETGNENPRKKTLSVNFSYLIQCMYSLFNMTIAEITSPIDKHKRAA